jgi:hypothetical protein
MGGVAMPPVNGAQPAGIITIPLSARKAQPLDLATVERRGHGAPNNQPPKPNRMFGLQESPTYRPTAEQFKDPVQYIQSIREEAQKYGIVKIIPPDSWNPSFAIDTEVCASCYFTSAAPSASTYIHNAKKIVIQLTPSSASTSARGGKSSTLSKEVCSL